MKNNSCIYGLTALIVTATAAWLVLFSTGCSMFGKKLTQLEKNSGVQYKNAVGYAGEQASKAFVLLSGKFPVYSEGSKWEDSELGSWAEGYYPGMVWFLYQTKKDTLYYRSGQAMAGKTGQQEERHLEFRTGTGFLPHIRDRLPDNRQQDFPGISSGSCAIYFFAFQQSRVFPGLGRARRYSIDKKAFR